MSLDLNKVRERKELVLDLAKDKSTSSVKLDEAQFQVVLAMDFSGSMSTLYSRGVVQETVERILPLGLAFDVDRQVDFYLFHDGVIEMPETLTTKNTDGYIDTKIIGKYNMGGTNYAPIINKIVAKYANKKEVKSGGWFGGAIGGKTETSVGPMETPVLVIFITDGENSDPYEAEKAIREAAEHGIFFKFVGIGSENFRFLQKLDDLKGRKVDNADFKKFNNIASISDKQLYSDFLDEIPNWLAEVKKLGMI